MNILDRIKTKTSIILNWIKDIQSIILEKFGIDKLLHALCGAVIFAAILVACMLNDLSFWIGLLIGIWITAFVGIFKEFFYDRLIRKGEFDIQDVIATIVGIPLFLFVLCVVLAIILIL